MNLRMLVLAGGRERTIEHDSALAAAAGLQVTAVFACAEAGLTPLPVRARDAAALLARPAWAALRETGAPGVVVLLDSLDEAADAIYRDRERFAAELAKLLSAGPYVVSSRVREYEELASGTFPDPGLTPCT
jgi:hypothetical protein